MEKMLQLILENIKNPSVFFVFPTEISAKLWAEKILDSSDTGTVAMERFVAWDSFKGESIRSTHQGKKSIPGVLRKMFASFILEKNKLAVESGDSPLFTSLINPDFVANSSGFSDWIAKLFPQLAIWKKYYDSKKNVSLEKDAENQDLLTLYTEYNNFLDSHSLFDPAWEMPPFESDGKEYVIFYPESLEGFAEYEELLNSSEQIKLITNKMLDTENDFPPAKVFSNSRLELHSLALTILELHKNKNIPYSKMSVSIPNPESMGPYVKREFDLYNIPYVYRVGDALASRGVGMLFSEILNCEKDDFSFASLKELLLNTELPWKESEQNRLLIQFGIDKNCLCSYEKDGKKIDVWAEAFASSPKETRLFSLYKKLKHSVQSFSNAKTFAEIKARYFAFREEFFNDSNFTEKADMILGREMSELASLMSVEQSFPDIRLPTPFAFFVKYLEEKIYLPQSKTSGVNIFKYRAAASAPFEIHFILDASQSAVEVNFTELSFLRRDKREALGITDRNVSSVYLNMYKQNSSEPVYYSFAEKSFSGYSILHNALRSEAGKDEYSELQDVKLDVMEDEKKYLLQNAPSLTELTELQSKSFEKWSHHAKNENIQSSKLLPEDLMVKPLYSDGCILISETSLGEFFTCSEQWSWKRIAALKSTVLDAKLMDDFVRGNIYHEIFELFFLEIQKSGMPLQPMADENVSNWYEKILGESCKKVFSSLRGSPLSNELVSGQENAFYKKVLQCIKKITSTFAGYSVTGTEIKYSYRIEDKPWLLYGKMDLELMGEDMSVCIVDFKTSSVPKDSFASEEKCELLGNYQCAMYTYLWEQNHENARVDTFTFFSIRDCDFTKVYGTIPGKNSKVFRENFNYSIQVLLDDIEIFGNAIESANFSGTRNPTFETCLACKYKAVCRKLYTVSGKRDSE